MSSSHLQPHRRCAVAAAVVIGAVAVRAVGARQAPAPQRRSRQLATTFNDSHFHLTNYIQEGIDVRDFLEIMGTRVGRSTLFGIPLQQQWSYGNSGDFAPDLLPAHRRAALLLLVHRRLHRHGLPRAVDRTEQARFDPMITGFNPADMYGVDHIKRVLKTFPGVFTGIGEFSIHKEFVSAKIAGETASLTNPALDRILDFAAESGCVVILHNDIDMPFGEGRHRTRLPDAR